MVKNTQDLRYVKTRRRIFAAVIELLKHETFDQITVREICQAAEVSRSGFYLHFEDKYDLVKEYQKDFMKRGTAIFVKSFQDQSSSVLKEVFHFLSQEGEMLPLLLGKDGSADVQEQIKRMLKQNAEQNILPKYGIKIDSPIVQRYLIAVMSGAVFGVLQEWIDSGRKESADELVVIFEKAVFPIIKASSFME